MSGVRLWRIAQIASVVGISLWVAGLFAAPGLLFRVGTLVCHQRPERSFFVHGEQLPVCARCTGLYIGAALAAPVAAAMAVSLSSGRARMLLGVAAIPTLASWALEFVGGVPFSNAARFAAALPLGFAAAWLVVAVLGDERRG